MIILGNRPYNTYLYTRSRLYGPRRDQVKIDHTSENDHISKDHITGNWCFIDHISENRMTRGEGREEMMRV